MSGNEWEQGDSEPPALGVEDAQPPEDPTSGVQVSAARDGDCPESRDSLSRHERIGVWLSVVALVVSVVTAAAVAFRRAR